MRFQGLPATSKKLVSRLGTMWFMHDAFTLFLTRTFRLSGLALRGVDQG
jgi:hypothetical protein